jgi:hypothetical protein
MPGCPTSTYHRFGECTGVVSSPRVAPVRTREAERRSVSTAKVLRLLGPACWSSE